MPPLYSGPVAHVSLLQTLAGLAVLWQTEPGTNVRTAIGAACAFSVLAMPLARLAAGLSRDHPSVYWWAGRVWAVAIPGLFAKTIPAAFDGSGPAMAERVITPFVLAAMLGLGFGIGAQGALFGVPKDMATNVQMLMVVMSAIKLQAAYTPAYLLVHVMALGGIALGYMCIVKYVDLREAEREAAEAVVLGAVAVNQPYVVTDGQLVILAVNQRFSEVMGYDADEVYGKPMSIILGASFNVARMQPALSKEQSDCVWTVNSKNKASFSVRITLGTTRCPINGTPFTWFKLASMALEQRNAQLTAEKERLQWDLAASQGQECDEADPREALGARLAEGTHRTLGVMQDQAETDEAVSCAHSFDHLTSSIGSPTLPGHALVASWPLYSEASLGEASTASLKSSVMDTVSQAAKKSPTRAPPPPKIRLPRPKTVRSEPSVGAKPKADNVKKASKRAMPTVERVGPDPREDC